APADPGRALRAPALGAHRRLPARGNAALRRDARRLTSRRPTGRSSVAPSAAPTRSLRSTMDRLAGAPPARCSRTEGLRPWSARPPLRLSSAGTVATQTQDFLVTAR